MRGVKEEYRFLDFIFRHEDEHNRRFIASSYSAAAGLRKDCAELADRRYRKCERRIKTCLDMYISVPQYYKLLRKFLVTAKAVQENLFAVE